MNDADPSKQRIISIELDEGSIVWRNPDVEQERRVAIFDLIEDNKFVPQRGHPDGYAGPYRLMLRVEERRPPPQGAPRSGARCAGSAPRSYCFSSLRASRSGGRRAGRPTAPSIQRRA